VTIKMEFTELVNQIAEQIPRLSPQLQLAARFVLDQPDDVALNSMRRVASDAGVHPTTMSRLARALEFSGYDEFREPFQERMRFHPADFIGRAQQLQDRVDIEDVAIVEEVMKASVGNLQDSFTSNGVERFVACAKALSKGKRVFVAGTRSCYPIVFYFNYVYSVFRTNSILMDGGGGTFADRLRSFGEDDVIFAASFAPYSQAAVKAVRFARETGGETIVLTDSMSSPIAGDPEKTLIIKNQSPSFFQSISASMAAAEALVALMVLEDGDDALTAIKNSERQLDRFDAYWAQAGIHTDRTKHI
jgi:DNA-binding MurR/RpiR family transcriptional regulator